MNIPTLNISDDPLDTPIKRQPRTDHNVQKDLHQFLHQRTSARPLSQKSQQQSLELRMQKQRERLKIDPMTKENKFNKKLERFTSLDTFVDIRKFLQDMNVLNHQSAYNQTRDLNHKLEALQRVQQLAEFRQSSQRIATLPLGYQHKLDSIQKLIPTTDSYFQESSLLNVRKLSKETKDSYMANHQTRYHTENTVRESDDPFYDALWSQLSAEADKSNTKTKVSKKNIKQLFGVNYLQLEEKARLQQKLYLLQKSLSEKLQTTAMLNEDVRTDSEEYYNSFKGRSKQVIHLLQKRQISELKQRQEEFDNMSMFTKKKTSPKKLVQFYKNRTFAAIPATKNKALLERAEQRQQSQMTLLKIISESSSHRNPAPNTQSTDLPPTRTAQVRFQGVVKKVLYNRSTNPKVKLQNLLSQLANEITYNRKDDEYIKTKIQRIIEVNDIQLEKYQGKQLESIRELEYKSAADQQHIDKLLGRE